MSVDAICSSFAPFSPLSPPKTAMVSAFTGTAQKRDRGSGIWVASVQLHERDFPYKKIF